MTDRVTEKISELLITSTDFLALPFEKNFNPVNSIEFARNNWPLAFGLVATYLVFIFSAQYVMKDRKPFDMRIQLAAWNAFLCIFSFIGMSRTVRKIYLRYLVANYYSICIF
jgi:hypothetical protein